MNIERSEILCRNDLTKQIQFMSKLSVNNVQEQVLGVYAFG